jgi:hypothetical protein
MQPQTLNTTGRQKTQRIGEVTRCKPLRRQKETMNDKEDEGKIVEAKIDERENGGNPENRQYPPVKIIPAPETD